VFVALLGLVFAGSARACSCARSTPTASMAEADAAIVGRLVAVVPRSAMVADYRYRVKRVYRGGKMIERGKIVSVRSSRSSAACALPSRTGLVYGLFLAREKARWVSGLCGVVSPHDLWTASKHRVRVYRRGVQWHC
jgi:Tissue inhibitor of metalloproteinase